jgi:endoglycosylceramidase
VAATAVLVGTGTVATTVVATPSAATTSTFTASTCSGSPQTVQLGSGTTISAVKVQGANGGNGTKASGGSGDGKYGDGGAGADLKFPTTTTFTVTTKSTLLVYVGCKGGNGSTTASGTGGTGWEPGGSGGQGVYNGTTGGDGGGGGGGSAIVDCTGGYTGGGFAGCSSPVTLTVAAGGGGGGSDDPSSGSSGYGGGIGSEGSLSQQSSSCGAGMVWQGTNGGGPNQGNGGSANCNAGGSGNNNNASPSQAACPTVTPYCGQQPGTVAVTVNGTSGGGGGGGGSKTSGNGSDQPTAMGLGGAYGTGGGGGSYTYSTSHYGDGGGGGGGGYGGGGGAEGLGNSTGNSDSGSGGGASGGTWYSSAKCSCGTATSGSSVPSAPAANSNSGVGYVTFSYTTGTSAVPTVTSLSPHSGGPVGGTSVTINGTNFVSGATVSFGGTAATGVTVVSSTKITATSPTHSAGTVAVKVTDSGGTSSTSTADQFTYGTTSGTSQTGPKAPITVADGSLVDATGRPVLLHGVNVVYKKSPYLPSSTQFNVTDVDAIKALGFNFVRLGFTWEGMEPTGPTIDTTYLDSYKTLVNLLTSHGIYVLVDAHQDLYGSYFGGEGAPNWAVHTDGLSYTEGPLWSLAYFDAPALQTAWTNFWDNWNTVQTDYLDMWKTVAKTFATNSHVLGYDIMNEPFPGTNFLTPGADTTTIEPFYKAAFRAIRTVDTTHTLFYENALTTNIGITPAISGLNTTDANIALSDHVYCPYTQIGLDFLDSLCKSSEQSSFAEEQTVAKDNGGAWLTTEMGATNDVTDIQAGTSVADTFLVGWAEWAWKAYGDPTGNTGEQMVVHTTGAITYEPKVTDGLERTYATAIGGTPTAQSFNPSTLAYSLTYTPNSVLNPYRTDIFVPKTLYTKGATVTVTGGTGAFSTANPDVYVVSASGSSAVTVTIANG